MNETRDDRLPAGLIGVLVYQWLLVLGSLGYVGIAAVVLLGNLPPDWDLVLGLVGVSILAAWGSALACALIGIMRRSPQGYRLGMICHLLLEVPGLPAVLLFGGAFAVLLLGNRESRAWAPLPLLFALMWLPFVLISGWAFFYLRRLRQSLLMKRGSADG